MMKLSDEKLNKLAEEIAKKSLSQYGIESISMVKIFDTDSANSHKLTIGLKDTHNEKPYEISARFENELKAALEKQFDFREFRVILHFQSELKRLRNFDLNTLAERVMFAN